MNMIRKNKILKRNLKTGIILKKFPIYLILPAIHATVIYFMVGYGCNGTHFAVFLFSDILIANAAFSLGINLMIIIFIFSLNINFIIKIKSKRSYFINCIK
jgi:hypothetical protein